MATSSEIERAIKIAKKTVQPKKGKRKVLLKNWKRS